MNDPSIDAFLDRLGVDPEFTARLEDVNSDPVAVQQILVAEGFELDPVAMREAFLGRFGSQLTEAQLAEVAGA